MKRNIFMNGITGQIGSFLAQELLGQGHTVYALVRGENPQQRIAQIAQKLNITDCSQLRILTGDIEKNLPQKPEIKIDHFIHIAADLSFSPKDSQRVTTTNILGTKNMLRLVDDWDCAYFHYFSTAYIAGKSHTKFSENDIHVGQDFKNAYEQSKAEAETICRKWAKKKQDKRTLKVYRPGIVMGNKDGCTLNYTGFYAFLKILAEIVKSKKNEAISSLRINACAQTFKNLIPVDYVVQAVAAILKEESKQNETIYLIPQKPPSNEEIRNWLATIFDLNAIELVSTMPEKPNMMERLLAKGLKVYHDYMINEPNFDCTYSKQRLANLEIPEPEINQEYFAHLIAYGYKDSWGRKKDNGNKTSQHPYFTQFLPSFLGKQMLPNLEKVNSVFTVKIKGECPEHWKLSIDKGILREVCPHEEDSKLEFCYEVPHETFNLIISGKIDPRAAFFSGKTDIIGNIEAGLKIANILRLFFNKHPQVVMTSQNERISAVS